MRELNLAGRMLVIAYSSFGDVISKFGAVRELKRKNPHLYITWLVCSPYRELVASQPFVDEIIVWDRSQGNIGFAKLLLEIRRCKFDIVLDLQRSDRALVMTLFSRASQRIGWHAWFPYVHNFFVQDALAFLGIDTNVLEKPRIFVPEEAKKRVKLLLSSPDLPLILCIIGASKPEKCWPVANWIEFLNLLTDLNVIPFLIGHGELEEDWGQTICSSTTNKRVKNLIGKLSFLEMGAACSVAAVALGGDTGPLHLAEAIGTSTIGLFGPTDPWDAGYKDIVFITVNCPHLGCQNWNCTSPCMETLKPLEIFGVTKDTLKGVL